MVKNASESSDRFCNFNLTDLSMYICTVSQAGYISLAICTVSFQNVFKTSLWWTCLWGWNKLYRVFMYSGNYLSILSTCPAWKFSCLLTAHTPTSTFTCKFWPTHIVVAHSVFYN